MTTGRRAPARPLTERPAWKALARHRQQMGNLHLRQMFAADPGRGERLTAEAAGLYIDYSKHRVTDETLGLLLRWADDCGLAERIEAMFRGGKINVTEQRAALNVALRAPAGDRILVDGADTSCPQCTRSSTAWRPSRKRSGAAAGTATRVGPSATSSTSASAAPTSVR
jgi:hypothetical protein